MHVVYGLKVGLTSSYLRSFIIYLQLAGGNPPSPHTHSLNFVDASLQSVVTALQRGV